VPGSGNAAVGALGDGEDADEEGADEEGADEGVVWPLDESANWAIDWEID